MNADGSAIVNLTQSPQSSDEWPQWSPDGSAIAFRSDRDGNAEIYTMRPDGTGQVNVSRSPLYDDFPAWTPDGRIGFQREGELWVMNRDGSEQQRVAGQAAFPAWTATAAGPPPTGDALVPTDGVAGMIEALDRHPLVAFGEEHGNELQHAFLRRLIRDASFRKVVDDVVVEFGNARYQRIVDRYVNGERVPISRVQHAWLDTTQRPSRVWSAPMYRRFFETVRSVNRGQPRAERVRVVLGDPPIDWSKVRTRADWERWIGRRGTHYINVVENKVLAKGHHALLIAGAHHLLRFGDDHENETAVLERRHPGSTFVVFPHAGFSPDASGTAEPEARLAAAGPAPWLARLSGTWVGALDTSLWGLEEGGAVMGDRANAFLYLGRR
jgi:WD40-like Beta Propeller Repeat/Haem-binding uptake, Tiki superfamily, ChaN